MALLIKIKDSVTTYEQVEPKGKTFSAEEVQSFVGRLYVLKRIGTTYLYVIARFNARGKGLPLNEAASVIYQFLADVPSDMYLFGDVLICKESELK